MKQPKVAIIYDRINKFGGAERVLFALREAFPESILFTSVADLKKAHWAHDWQVKTSFLQHIPFARIRHEWFGWLMPLAFESLDLSGFDLIISVTSEAAKGVITKPNQLHVCYCLTPTRYLWSHTHEYEGARFSWLKRFFFHKLREWDYIAAQRPDILIPISKMVEQRIKKYYRRKTSEVIYPPVKMSKTQYPCLTGRQAITNKKNYYLVVSRLVSYKRIDLAIEACIKLQKKLVIVGVGSDESRLRKIAGNSEFVTFRGFVSEKDLVDIYHHARALICPQEEDFGIVSIEAQSQGTPVVTYHYSGITETIIQGKTGMTFKNQTIAGLCAVLEEFETLQWDPSEIASLVTRFSTARFIREIHSIVQ